MSKKGGLWSQMSDAFSAKNLDTIVESMSGAKKEWDKSLEETKKNNELAKKEEEERAKQAAVLHQQRLEQAQIRQSEILLSCGEFNRPYEIIDVISVVSSAQGDRSRGGLTGALMGGDQNELARQKAFEQVKANTRFQGAYFGGDGVQNLQFSHAKAMTAAGSLTAGKHIWSYFAYGTVVKFT